eukprot:TRINITY_DN16700_c0_g1_i1.p1 TRINITY_DN16700_c0_g1~~TRINITY_DN16700_c0_g1_i1.p1  ORF type:complete len:299 (-),score=110.65 TRINITY_DN16700_c0_g1_i1:109-1005(-)
MKIAIVGLGYFGSAISEELLKAGHTVYGIVRDESKPSALKLKEELGLNIVKGSLNEPEAFKDVLLDCDVLINTAQDGQNPSAGSRSIVEAFINAAEESNEKKIVVFTSGCLVYGDQGENTDLLSETSEYEVPDIFKWRVEDENTIISSDKIKGIVLRPGYVYGRSGSYIGCWFNANKNNKQVIPLSGNNYWPTINVEDLARAYRAVIEQADQSSGKIFNLVSHNNTLLEIATASAKSSGFNGEIEHNNNPESLWDKIFAWNIPLDGSLVTNTIDFQYTGKGFIESNQEFHDSWLEAQN